MMLGYVPGLYLVAEECPGALKISRADKSKRHRAHIQRASEPED
ncbi:MAG: hypothetical protein RQM92_12385 [Candidatus Syntrophopropionicum ammoniitolerans]